MNWNYIAGFFDGEGCFTICYDKNNKVKYQLSLSQTHKGVLDHIQLYINCGKVYEAPHRGNKNWKSSWLTAYSLRISKRKDILFFIKNIENKIIVKKEEVATKKKILLGLDNIQKKKWERIRAHLKVCKRMRVEGNSWKQIGEVINKNAESARCFVKEHRYKQKYSDIFG